MERLSTRHGRIERYAEVEHRWTEGPDNTSEGREFTFRACYADLQVRGQERNREIEAGVVEPASFLDTPSSGSYVLNGAAVQGMDDTQLAGIRNREIPTWARKTQPVKAHVPMANIWPQVRKVPTSSGHSVMRACASDNRSAKTNPIKTLSSVMNSAGN